MLAPLVLSLALSTCASTLPQRLVPSGPARQLVTVTAQTASSTRGDLRLWARTTGGCWEAAGGPWPARLGRAGVSAFGATMYGVAANPGVRFHYRRLACGDWWDGDSSSPTYNRFRHVPCGETPPFRGASEALWEQHVAYRYFAVIGFNDAPVVP